MIFKNLRLSLSKPELQIMVIYMMTAYLLILLSISSLRVLGFEGESINDLNILIGVLCVLTGVLSIQKILTVRKKRETQLHKSKEILELFIEHAPVSLAMFDQEMRYLVVSQRWIADYQLDDTNVTGRSHYEIFPEIPERWKKAHHLGLTGQVLGVEEDNFVRIDGSIQWLRWEIRPWYTDDGVVGGIIIFTEDITTLKMVEQQFRESEYFAHATVNALSAHIAILDENGVILAVNDAWNRFATANDARLDRVGIGVNYLEILKAVDDTSDDVSTARAVLLGIQRIIRKDITTFYLEYPCHSLNEQRWFVVRITRFATYDASRIVVAHENITDRVVAEKNLAATNVQLEALVEERTAQLQRLNNRMMSILDNVSTPVLLIHSDGLIDITNPAFNRKLDYQPDDLFAQPFWGIFDTAYHSTLISALDQVHTEKALPPIQAKLITKNGITLDAEVSLAEVSNSDDIVCTLYDISHLKEVERIKDEFISMMNHELRTPLTSIMLNANMLQQYFDRLSEDRKLEKIVQILRQAQTLSELVTSILDLSQVNALQEKRSVAQVDIGQTLQETVQELSAQAEFKRQTIHIQAVNNIFTLTGEHLDLTRIWRNLLSNAVKYTPENGTIRVKLYGACSSNKCELPDLADFIGQIPEDIYSGRYIIGLVEDNGHGMNAQDVSHLFTRFYRGWAAASDIPGTGLGMSLVRDLLKLYEGDIAVSSKLEIGTTFCFWLPVDQIL